MEETFVQRLLGDDDARFSVLTPRERAVMRQVATGKPNKVIAAELGVSQRTIEAHRARIFQKMKVRNAVELILRLQAQHEPRPSISMRAPVP